MITLSGLSGYKKDNTHLFVHFSNNLPMDKKGV